MIDSLVSICIPSYNYARYLPDAIESAVSQTYPNIEVIIVDDGSTDDSVEIALNYEKKYLDIVKVFRHENNANRGVSATINEALSQSSGAYWCVMGADDIYFPNKTSQQVKALEEQPNWSFVYSRTAIIDRDRVLIAGSMGDDITQSANPLELMVYGNAIPAPTVMVRRDRVGPKDLWHDEKLLHSDWELWVRLIARFNFGFIDEALILYRIHGDNVSINLDASVDLQHRLDVMTTLREKADAVGGELGTPRIQALLDLQRSYLLFKLARRKEAANALNVAFITDPSLRTESFYVARWLDGREREFARFVLTNLRQQGLIDASSLISLQWLYVRSKPIVKNLVGTRMTEFISGVRRRTLRVRPVRH